MTRIAAREALVSIALIVATFTPWLGDSHRGAGA